MGSDLIYGQNDSFVLAWIVFSLWLWQRGEGRGGGWQIASAAVFGLACASKPTAWFLAPFYLLWIAAGSGRQSRPRRGPWLRQALRPGWPALVTALLVAGPYFVWNPAAMFDDVWKWSAGTSATAYQIWGWGGVESRAGARLGQEPLRRLAVLASRAAGRRAADGCAAGAPVAREHAGACVVGLRALPLCLLLRVALSERELPGVHRRFLALGGLAAG